MGGKLGVTTRQSYEFISARREKQNIGSDKLRIIGVLESGRVKTTLAEVFS
jgi:hypothetical protein